MSSSCLHCEGWGCRRCRRDYGEQMPDVRYRQKLEDIAVIVKDARAFDFIPNLQRFALAAIEEVLRE